MTSVCILLTAAVTLAVAAMLPPMERIWAHEKVGLTGRLLIGKGGAPAKVAQAETPAVEAPRVAYGVGVVVVPEPHAASRSTSGVRIPTAAVRRMARLYRARASVVR